MAKEIRSILDLADKALPEVAPLYSASSDYDLVTARMKARSIAGRADIVLTTKFGQKTGHPYSLRVIIVRCPVCDKPYLVARINRRGCVRFSQYCYFWGVTDTCKCQTPPQEATQETD